MLPRVLRLLPWRQRSGLRLHVVASNAVPDDLALLLRKHSGHVVFHGYLPDKEASACWSPITPLLLPPPPLLLPPPPPLLLLRGPGSCLLAAAKHARHPCAAVPAGRPARPLMSLWDCLPWAPWARPSCWPRALTRGRGW